jgi:DNA-binding HxlR family transcriptional regulator
MSPSGSTKILPHVPFKECPIQASLGILGRKWTFLVIRDMGMLGVTRFNEFVRNNPGLTPRALSLLLRDLQREGLIHRSEEQGSTKKRVTYSLTKKGKDVLPVLTALIGFGMNHYADVVFEDGKARNLTQVFPGSQAELLGPLLPYVKGKRSGVPSFG